MNQIGNFSEMTGAIDRADNPPYQPVPVGGPSPAAVLAANPPKPGNFTGAGVYTNVIAETGGKIAQLYDEFRREERNRKKFKELLAKGERGAVNYVEELRKKCPGIDEYIPPMDFFRDAETGELDAVKYYDHAHRGYQEWKKDQAAAKEQDLAQQEAEYKARKGAMELGLEKQKVDMLRNKPVGRAPAAPKIDEQTPKTLWDRLDRALAEQKKADAELATNETLIGDPKLSEEAEKQRKKVVDAVKVARTRMLDHVNSFPESKHAKAWKAGQKQEVRNLADQVTEAIRTGPSLQSMPDAGQQIIARMTADQPQEIVDAVTILVNRDLELSLPTAAGMSAVEPDSDPMSDEVIAEMIRKNTGKQNPTPADIEAVRGNLMKRIARDAGGATNSIGAQQ